MIYKKKIYECDMISNKVRIIVVNNKLRKLNLKRIGYFSHKYCRISLFTVSRKVGIRKMKANPRLF